MSTDRKALRRQMIRQRETMTPAEWEAASAQLSSNLETVLAQRGLPKLGQVVAFCWPVQNEPDIRPLMLKWRAAGIMVALPVVIAPGQPLVFRVWSPESKLEPDQYGIPTPTDGPLVTPNILLLPGNAFDDAGYRLGYGGGFFDRTLAVMTPRPLVIGLCFENARIADLKPESHDQAVDVVVTEIVPRAKALAVVP
jgi:5-formyltetrahydrofolate cyclo-ligase